jgi:hypothetical protein
MNAKKILISTVLAVVMILSIAAAPMAMQPTMTMNPDPVIYGQVETFTVITDHKESKVSPSNINGACYGVATGERAFLWTTNGDFTVVKNDDRTFTYTIEWTPSINFASFGEVVCNAEFHTKSKGSYILEASIPGFYIYP